METISLNPIVFAAPLLIALIIGEIIYSKLKGHTKLYYWKDFLASAGSGLATLLLNPVAKFIFSAILFYGVYNLFNPIVEGVRINLLGYEAFGWAWYTWILALFLNDFSHYWVHRCNHTVRIMWAAHMVHHSSEHYNYGTALRLSCIAIFYKPLFYLWLPAIGFHPEMIIVCMGVESVWQFLLHTSYCPKLGWLEFLLITPKQHQVHHATNLQYLDKNHGAIFSIFDRLFGTWKEFQEEDDINYGVLHGPNSYNPIKITTYEFKAIWLDVKNAKSLKEVFMYVFGPPGWSPDGSSLTVKQLQQKL
ncbi:sterol desaturase family protein [Seonamhaeicola aphaedonensis]|uniref:Fatty acid hydroxylase family protein n=1 Tax=Seonamhaeicola aphaedonensis TaxID=1461338 RepID=A0A3D9HMN1_9FLAO|nr:sterol desaturase family protein [Seonamhaeicola aphaedonensis]RED50156.1 fatty acid hydroxylase family protein [Seonamhaeicola aphaedonensis]